MEKQKRRVRYFPVSDTEYLILLRMLRLYVRENKEKIDFMKRDMGIPTLMINDFEQDYIAAQDMLERLEGGYNALNEQIGGISN